MTYRAQIEALLTTGTYPGDAEAAKLIGCSHVTAEDYRQRWQRVNGEQHKNKSGIMPREAVDLVFDLRGDGLSFKEIAQRVNEQHGEYYGIRVTTEQCGNLYRRHGYKKPVSAKIIDYLGSYAGRGGTLVPAYTFPLATAVGTMWGMKITAPKFPRTKVNTGKQNCDFCPHLAHCLAHPEDICRCESAWESEVL